MRFGASSNHPLHGVPRDLVLVAHAAVGVACLEPGAGGAAGRLGYRVEGYRLGGYRVGGLGPVAVGRWGYRLRGGSRGHESGAVPGGWAWGTERTELRDPGERRGGVRAAKGADGPRTVFRQPICIISYPILILSHPTLPYTTPPYRTLPYPILPDPILSYPTRSYPILSCPILSYPTLRYPIRSYPIPFVRQCHRVGAHEIHAALAHHLQHPREARVSGARVGAG